MTDAQINQSRVNGDAESMPPEPGNGAAPVEAEVPELAAVIAERDEYLDLLKRSQADFANYRRRVEQERGQIRETANQSLLAQLLPVLDDLQRAVEAVPDDQRDTPLAQGLQLIARKYWAILERAGVSPIDAVGQRFDPSIHEAVELVPGGASDTIVAVYQAGYRLGQSLLRPAMVKVGPDDNGKAAEADAGTERDAGLDGGVGRQSANH